MSRARAGLAQSLAIGLVGAATTWITLFAWRGFVADPEGYLEPLAVLGILLALVGALTRWARWHPAAVVASQVAVLISFLARELGGSVLPGPTTVAAARDAVVTALEAAQAYSSPVPVDAPSVHPLLILGGGVCLLLVDLCAGTLRRAPLAGLPLLTIYSLPVSLLPSLSAWVFVGAAAGYLALLLLQESQQLHRWGRSLAARGDAERRPAGTGRGSAVGVAAASVALAVAAPALVPTFQLELIGVGRGSGSGDGVTLENPMADLRRDLFRGDDIPLLRVRTSEPDPAYLRIAVLNRFSGNAWSPGDREVPASQVARGEMPLRGVRTRIPRREFPWALTITRDFRSTWLPTPSPISEINAGGGWRYDESTMDFLAHDSDLDTSAIQYRATAVRLELDAASMAQVPSGRGAVGPDFVELPDDLPSIVEELAVSVTEGAPSDFEKAAALQRWFREEGDFTYSLETDPGSGSDDLVAFLDERVGYCEQFAATMAVMARSLDIPARVAIGFLRPEQVTDGVWEYSAWDLHAWPEIYISGHGWVAFEPTPADRAATAPGYTTQPVPRPDDTNPDRAPSPTTAPDVERDPALPDLPEESETGAVDGSEESRIGLVVATVLGGGLLLLAVLALPRLRRDARRRRRWLDGGTPESAWAELRDSVLDHGLPWPAGRSPRATAEVVASWFAVPSEHDAPVRPERGPRTNPAATASLEALVEMVERSRYAARPAPADPHRLRRHTEAAIAGFRAGVATRGRRRADWWPSSAFRREQPFDDRRERETDQLVDHLSGQ